MSVTLKDIAKAAGVSHNSVSCALRGTGRLEDSTRQRIIKLAREMGYKPNIYARAVRTGRFNCLAVLQDMDGYRTEMNAWLFRHILESATERGQHLHLSYIPDKDLKAKKSAPKILTELIADGLIINYHSALPAAMHTLIEQHDFPYVFINRKRENNTVYPDEYGAMQVLAEKLIGLGHRRILYIDSAYAHDQNEQKHFSREDHLAAYKATMEEHGLPPVTELGFPGPRPKDPFPWRSRITGDNRPTAIITHNPGDALDLLVAAPFLGVSIPDDLSLATFNHLPIERYVKVSVMARQWSKVGHEAVDMLMRRIAKPSIDLASKAIPFEYREGDSVSPCRTD